jgi:hypothetical protein
MEEKIQEKKELSVAEIEAQSVLELPDRQLMQNSVIENNIVTAILVFLNVAVLVAP